MSQILFIHLFLRNNFIVQNLFTYLDLYTKHQGCLSPLLLGGGAGGVYTANLPAGLNQWDPPTGFLAVPTSTQRAEGQRIIGYFSTMRMTIYLLDGCSADYIIIKNNFHPLPCIGAIFRRIFLIGFTGIQTPSQDHGKRSSMLWMLWARVWGQKGEGPGIR